MNQYIEKIPFGTVAASDLPDWALAHGIGSLSTEDVAHLIGVPVSYVPQRMVALRRKSQLFSPARGLWIPVPVEYRTWGAPDSMTYIDEMMAHLDVDYCVGWLSAAAFHGASHHAAQTFQVAVGHTVRERICGRSRLEFFSRSYVGLVTLSHAAAQRTRAKIASVGTTMLMLASDAGISGGMDNVATLVVELAEGNPGFKEELLADAALFPDAAARRIGWFLDRFAGGAPADLLEYCSELESSVSFISPSGPRTGKMDACWNVIVNREIDPDL